jgi:hypothetical protein
MLWGKLCGEKTLFKRKVILTIALVKNGKSISSQTRHIAIRYFFVSNNIEKKEIDIEYMPTERMFEMY